MKTFVISPFSNSAEIVADVSSFSYGTDTVVSSSDISNEGGC